MNIFTHLFGEVDGLFDEEDLLLSAIIRVGKLVGGRKDD